MVEQRGENWVESLGTLDDWLALLLARVNDGEISGLSLVEIIDHRALLLAVKADLEASGEGGR